MAGVTERLRFAAWTFYTNQVDQLPHLRPIYENLSPIRFRVEGQQ